MIGYSSRFFKRFAVLIPGLIIAYFSVRNIFPYFNKRLPLALAIFVTYVVGAYALIPALIRVARIVRPPKHLPLYCVTPDGFASDPLNIAIKATRLELIEAMEQVGWYVADPHTPRYMLREIFSFIFNWSYPTAPLSGLYLFGRKQDVAFEIPIEGSGTGSRHHVRFWATTYENNRRISARSIHWHHRRAHIQAADLLWVGAASLDIGIAPIRHNLQLTHMIHPDTDEERNLIVQQLKSAEKIVSIETVKLQKPYRLANRALRGYLQADGKMSVVELLPNTIVKQPETTGRHSRNHSR